MHSRFDFDSSFNANTSQEEVFRKVQPFVISKYSFDSIGAGSVSKFYRNVHIMCICFSLFIGAMDGLTVAFLLMVRLEVERLSLWKVQQLIVVLMYEALQAMFEEGHARRKSLGMAFTFSVTMCEIYREEVYDLLQEKEKMAFAKDYFATRQERRVCRWLAFCPGRKCRRR